MDKDSEFKEVVPYRTATGLEIGKFYQPPKVYGSGEDALDLRDTYTIQSALISRGAPIRRYRSFDIGFAVGIVLWFTVIVLLS